jgi:hypothetical protein
MVETNIGIRRPKASAKIFTWWQFPPPIPIERLGTETGVPAAGFHCHPFATLRRGGPLRNWQISQRMGGWKTPACFTSSLARVPEQHRDVHILLQNKGFAGGSRGDRWRSMRAFVPWYFCARPCISYFVGPAGKSLDGNWDAIVRDDLCSTWPGRLGVSVSERGADTRHQLFAEHIPFRR